VLFCVRLNLFSLLGAFFCNSPITYYMLSLCINTKNVMISTMAGMTAVDPCPQSSLRVRRNGEEPFKTAEWEQWLRDLQDGENPPLSAAP
jgi:hypothetical protein